MPRFAANLTLLFNEHDFLDRFEPAAKAGFEGVEYLFPYAWEAETLARHLTGNGLQQVLFNLPPGDWEAGERGVACHPGRESEFRRGVEQALAYADRLGCRQMNCLAGLVPESSDPSQCWDTLLANLAWAADALASEGCDLMVEAINSRVDMPGFFLDRCERVVAALDAIDRPNAYLQLDLYHQQIQAGDLIRTFERYRDRIGHIQFADNPGRHEPGTGEIHFPRVFEAIDAAGYRGWVSAEYRPSGSTEASLETWLSRP
ncbi:hydroxypyruvate isomerase [Marinobacteraceae bacterium S3BR75-40.1]